MPGVPGHATVKVALGLSVSVTPVSVVWPELVISPEKLTCTAASPDCVTNWVPGNVALGYVAGTAQFFEMVILLEGVAEQAACWSFEQTVVPSVQEPGLPLVGDAAAIA